MKSETKAKLRTVSKCALKVTKFVLEDMQNTTKLQSKNKRYPEEYREQYAEMAGGLESMSKSVSSYIEKLEKADVSVEADDIVSDCEGFQEIESCTLEVTPSISTFDNKQKAQIQFDESSSYVSMDFSPIEEWNLQWISIGGLDDIDKTVYNQVGLIRFIIGDDTVFVTRAIELKRGGISQKLYELRNFSGKKSTISRKISENYNEINVLILIVGNSEEDVTVCRNLETKMIKFFKPLWIERMA